MVGARGFEPPTPCSQAWVQFINPCLIILTVTLVACCVTKCQEMPIRLVQIGHSNYRAPGGYRKGAFYKVGVYYSQKKENTVVSHLRNASHLFFFRLFIPSVNILKLVKSIWHLPKRCVVFHGYLIQIIRAAFHLYSFFEKSQEPPKKKFSDRLIF